MFTSNIGSAEMPAAIGELRINNPSKPVLWLRHPDHVHQLDAQLHQHSFGAGDYLA